MAQSKAKDVDGYIAEASPERRPHLERLRDLCRSKLTGFREMMAYGMPAYQRGDEPGGVAFANQKQYVAVYITNMAVVARNAEALKGHDMGKSCLRFKNPAKIDWPLVEQLLADTRDADVHEGC
ncbi:MAG TPA: DUF1801 domain-containing protein [Caulobacteraceae bacterium]|jgi:uncharacterized protein YdhG (YjbR/CyaY superfamily)